MKNGFVDFSGKGGGEGSKNFDHKFYKFEQPNSTNSFDKKNIHLSIWCFAHKTCKSDKGTCPHARPLKVMQNQACNSRGEKK
jgi:hypothetical protein